METTVALLAGLSPLAVALAQAVPRLRPPLAAGLAVLVVLAAFLAATAAGTRELEVVHMFQGFVGNQPTAVDFPVETRTAPAGRWALVVAAWAALWAGWAWRTRRAARPSPGLGAPLLLAWSAVALLLLLQVTAGPLGLVRPLGLERMVFPATLGAALCLALRSERFLGVLFQLVAFAALVRVPIALFSFLASEGGWGTSLDVHTIEFFANPFTQKWLEVAPRSGAQYGWLIWGPHLIILPALYLLSLGGIAFAVYQFHRHPPPSRPRPVS